MINQKTRIYRILDANLDRAREGLRIIEEWCRFGLNDSETATLCKSLRQELATWHTYQLRTARDTPNDPTTDITHPNEAERANIESLLQANLCRVEEALRVLEEYGKLYDAEFSSTMKQMRYQVYTLESELLGQSRWQLLEEAKLYLVTSPVENFLTVVESALQGGLTLVQYRHKDDEDMTKLREAYKLKQLCNNYDALFIINDRIDLAVAVDADGVHLGQTDFPVALARQMLGQSKIIGKSTTNPQEMAQAISDGADYIGVGPVYATPTKADKKPAGLEYVKYAKNHATIPWFAIGGIDNENLPEVIEAGAERVAVVRAIMEAENPDIATRKLLNLL